MSTNHSGLKATAKGRLRDETGVVFQFAHRLDLVAVAVRGRPRGRRVEVPRGVGAFVFVYQYAVTTRVPEREVPPLICRRS